MDVPVLVRLLGLPRVGDTPLPVDKRGCLLSYLAYAGEWISRESLAFLFYPDSDEGSARRNLRQLLSRVKRLPTVGLEVQATRVRWSVDTDVARFRRALARQDWPAAVALHGDGLLAGFQGQAAGGFEAWLELERGTLQSANQAAALRMAAALMAERRYDQAADALRPIVEADPLAEDVLQRYLEALYLSGKREAALAAYRRFAERLHEELGLQPLERTQQLHAAMRRATPAAELRAPAEGLPLAVPASVLRPPRLVGREPVLEAALRATAPVVLLAGEAGIGKSRLLSELAPDALVLRCHEGLQNVPYHPVVAQLRRRLADGAALPALGSYLEDIARLVPEAAPGLVPGPTLPRTAKVRLLEALARYLEGASTAGARFRTVFDDLQWADEATLELLGYLSTRPSSRVLGAYRIHEATPALTGLLTSLRSRQALRVLELRPLDAGQFRELLAQLIGVAEGPPAFSDWLQRTTGGNPMFALETLKALFEAGVLRASQRGWHTAIDDVTLDYRELETPAVVADVIARRVAGLAGETVRTLQAAAVIGDGFAARLLGPVSGLSAWAVAEALDEAGAAGVIDGERFRHDLLRQSLYRSVPAARRRLLHGRVAEALAEGGDPLVVAEHWLAAGATDRALAAWRHAAAELRERSLHQEAVKVLERARAQADAQAARLPLLADLAVLYTESSRLEEAEQLVETLLAEASSDAVRLSALLTKAVLWLYQRGRLEIAAALLQEARALVGVGTEEGLAYRYWLLEVDVLYFQGRYPEGLASCRARYALELGRPLSERRFRAVTMTARFLDALGQHAEALRLYLEGLAMVEALGAAHLKVYSALGLLPCYGELGRHDEGVALAEETLALGEFLDSTWLRNNLATTYLRLGRLEEASRHSRVIVEAGDVNFAGVSWARLAEIHHRAGQRDAGRRAIEQAVAHLADSQVPAVQALTLIPILAHGSGKALARARQAARRLDPASVPRPIRGRLEQALGAPADSAGPADPGAPADVAASAEPDAPSGPAPAPRPEARG